MQNKLKQLVDQSQNIVVIQADNPDADSLASALTLEQIFSEMGKNVVLYCGADMPDYLRYLSGWDRVLKDLPNKFDISIIVDASTLTLLTTLETSGKMAILKSKPCVVLDHHSVVENEVDFSDYKIVDPEVASTGELIFSLAKNLGWKLDKTSSEFIMASILGDTQGLTNDLTRASTYNVMAELVDIGVSRPELEELRREAGKMVEKIYRYKAELISRTEITNEGKIASVTIPQNEINEFSPLYNPAALVQFDMLQVKEVKLTIVFKHYDSGRVTGAIRAAYGCPVAAKLAESMGGGGHLYASGFKDESGRSFDEIKTKCLKSASELIAKIESDEAI